MQDCYCLMCDQEYQQDANVACDFVCPQCAKGLDPQGGPYAEAELADLRKRVSAVNTIINRQLYEATHDLVTSSLFEGTQNGLAYAYGDAIDVFGRLSKKEAVKVLQKHLNDVKAEQLERK